MKKLHLASRVSRLGYRGFVLTTFDVKSIEIEKLYLPVRPVDSFAEDIRLSIKEEGLRQPVLVVPMLRDELIAEYTRRGHGVESVPEQPWLLCVCGGINRIHAARTLGYTHIDCLLVPDFDVAIQLQERQRNEYLAKTQT